MRGLIDTNIVIHLAALDPEQLPDEMVISAVTLAELSAGPHHADDPRERAVSLPPRFSPPVAAPVASRPDLGDPAVVAELLATLPVLIGTEDEIVAAIAGTPAPLGVTRFVVRHLGRRHGFR